MSSKENRTNNPKLPTTTSIKVKERPRSDMPKILSSKNPGFGMFVYAKSEPFEPKKHFKITSRPKTKAPLDSIQEIKHEAKSKAKKSLIEILEKELTNKISDLEDKTGNNRILKLDVEKSKEQIEELKDVV